MQVWRHRRSWFSRCWAKAFLVVSAVGMVIPSGAVRNGALSVRLCSWTLHNHSSLRYSVSAQAWGEALALAALVRVIYSVIEA